MRFTHPHTLNGHRYDTGEAFTGNVSVGRFLYQRGHLEPDGAPEDEAITAKLASSSWNSGDRSEDTPEPKPAPRRRATRAAKKKE